MNELDDHDINFIEMDVNVVLTGVIAFLCMKYWRNAS